MANDEFVAYVGDPEIHDAVVKVSYNGQRAEVSIETLNGRRIDIAVSDVRLFHAHEPLGMALYALNEMRGIPPHRKFVFTNFEESSDSVLSLEAREFVCK